MEVKGKVVKVLDLETGISKAGKEWQKQSIVIDTGEDFNNIVCVNAFGQKVKDLVKLKVGMTATILCNVYSREYNGKYYHNIDGYHFTNQSNADSSSRFVTVDDNDMPF
jgi:hypothetical protein